MGPEPVRAFVPAPLPPAPPLALEGAVRETLDRALLALGRLDGISDLLPSVHLFIYSYVRKEAVLSSQIEGTQSTLSDLLLFELEEAPGAPLDDVLEVSGYVSALEHGLGRLRDGLPISNRLIREIHDILLARGRGAGKAPGEFRLRDEEGNDRGGIFFAATDREVFDDVLAAIGVLPRGPLPRRQGERS